LGHTINRRKNGPNPMIDQGGASKKTGWEILSGREAATEHGMQGAGEMRARRDRRVPFTNWTGKNEKKKEKRRNCWPMNECSCPFKKTKVFNGCGLREIGEADAGNVKNQQ